MHDLETMGSISILHVHPFGILVFLWCSCGGSCYSWWRVRLRLRPVSDMQVNMLGFEEFTFRVTSRAVSTCEEGFDRSLSQSYTI